MGIAKSLMQKDLFGPPTARRLDDMGIPHGLIIRAVSSPASTFSLLMAVLNCFRRKRTEAIRSSLGPTTAECGSVERSGCVDLQSVRMAVLNCIHPSLGQKMVECGRTRFLLMCIYRSMGNLWTSSLWIVVINC